MILFWVFVFSLKRRFFFLSDPFWLRFHGSGQSKHQPELRCLRIRCFGDCCNNPLTVWVPVPTSILLIRQYWRILPHETCKPSKPSIGNGERDRVLWNIRAACLSGFWAVSGDTQRYIVRKVQERLRHHFIEELNSFQCWTKIADINNRNSLIYYKVII